jgi:hypothetical protein
MLSITAVLSGVLFILSLTARKDGCPGDVRGGEGAQAGDWGDL